MANKRSIVDILRQINSVIDFSPLKTALTAAEWDDFAEMVDKGMLVFSADGTGFHFKIGKNSVVDCSRLVAKGTA